MSRARTQNTLKSRSRNLKSQNVSGSQRKTLVSWSQSLAFTIRHHCYSGFPDTRMKQRKVKMFLAGLEPATFRVTGERDTTTLC